MTENLNSGVVLLMVGMITVFTILFLVISTGKVLILIVNRYFPEKGSISQREIEKVSISHPDNKIVSVLNSVVEEITEGRGKITRIDKIK